MTCTEFLALLDDLIDDSVSSEARAELQQHLRGCEHCEVTLDVYKRQECPWRNATWACASW